MRYLSVVLLCVLVAGMAFSQARPYWKSDVFVPKLLSAGTTMSARTVSSSMDDTTQAFDVRDWSSVVIVLRQVSGDSATVYVSYQGSEDGVTFESTFNTIDSLVNTSNGVAQQQGFPLPAAAMGYQSVRVRIEGEDWGDYSSNPSGTLKTIIVRKHQ